MACYICPCCHAQQLAQPEPVAPLEKKIQAVVLTHLALGIVLFSYPSIRFFTAEKRDLDLVPYLVFWASFPLFIAQGIYYSCHVAQRHRGCIETPEIYHEETSDKAALKHQIKLYAGGYTATILLTALSVLAWNYGRERKSNPWLATSLVAMYGSFFLPVVYLYHNMNLPDQIIRIRNVWRAERSPQLPPSQP